MMLFAAAFTGCERGCLMRGWTEKQEGPPPSASGQTTPLDLRGVDCADGLLRCNGGVIETSLVGHLPAKCLANERNERRMRSEKAPAECICPWSAIGQCRSGCANDNLEIVATDLDAGASQMCKPLQPYARPILPEDHASIEVCADDGISCRDGIVTTCVAASPSRPIAHCIFGCALGVSLAEEPEDGPAANPDGFVSILCKHSDAERR